MADEKEKEAAAGPVVEGEDIDVVLEADEGKTVEGKADAGGGTTVTDDIEAVRRKLDEADRARIAAEQRALEAERRASSATANVASSQMAVLDSALDALTTQREQLEGKLEEAFSSGDFKAAAKLQGDISDVAVRRMEIEKGKTALQASTAAAAAAPGAGDVVEQFASRLEKPAADWIRAHPDYVTDPMKNAHMLEQHYAAVRKGIKQGSPDYFTFIEIGLGLRPAAASTTQTPARVNGNGSEASVQRDPVSAAGTPTQKRDDVQPSPAASSRGESRRTVRLSPAQQEAARMSNMSNQEYAQRMVEEERKGNIGKKVH